MKVPHTHSLYLTITKTLTFLLHPILIGNFVLHIPTFIAQHGTSVCPFGWCIVRRVPVRVIFSCSLPDKRPIEKKEGKKLGKVPAQQEASFFFVFF